MSATPIFNGSSPRFAGASPVEQPPQEWLRDLQSVPYASDFPESYPRVGRARRRVIGRGSSMSTQPPQGWLREEAANYPSEYYPSDYPGSYPDVGGSETPLGPSDLMDPIFGRSHRRRAVGCGVGCSIGEASKLATNQGLWLKTRIHRDGHYLKATTYMVAAGEPKVFCVKVDLRPLYKAAVALHKRLMGPPPAWAVAGDTLIGKSWWKRFSRKVKKTVKKAAKNTVVKAVRKVHRSAVRFGKALARSPIVPALGAVLSVFPPTAAVGVGVTAAWTVANRVVKAADAAENAAKRMSRDIKKGKVSAKNLLSAAAAGASAASAVTGGRVNLAASAKGLTKGLTAKGTKALGTVTKNLRGRVNLKAARKVTKALRSKNRKARRQGAAAYKLFSGKASARGLAKGLASKATRAKSAKALAFLASSKPLSADPRKALAQGRSAVAAKYLSLAGAARATYLARIKAKGKAMAKSRTKVSAKNRAAMAGALSIVKDVAAMQKAVKAKRTAADPRVKATLIADHEARKKAQAQIKGIAQRARYATGAERLKAKKAAAVLSLAAQNNARIASTVERNAGGLPSILIDAQGNLKPGRWRTTATPTGINADVLYTGPGKTQLTGRFARVAGVGYAPPSGSYPIYF